MLDYTNTVSNNTGSITFDNLLFCWQNSFATLLGSSALPEDDLAWLRRRVGEVLWHA